MSCIEKLESMLLSLGLKAIAAHHSECARLSEENGLSYLEYLAQLIELELEYRQQKRIERLTKQAQLPCDKSLDELNLKRLKGALSPSQLKTLQEGAFIDRKENLLLFGNPGTGKTHLCIGLAQAWCQRGRKVMFTSAANLVQRLLRAKRDLELDKLMKRLDRVEVLIIDDISYVPYDRQETDVLFTLLSERYERRSLMITSNAVFSEWETIFKDKMTTAAAIDRLVHHASILELNVPSFRSETARSKQGKTGRTEPVNPDPLN